MAKVTKRKYATGSEVTILKTHYIEDGLITNSSKGFITGYDSKTNKYIVSIPCFGGGSIEEKYDEYEIMLADLSMDDASTKAKELANDIKTLRKKNNAIGVVMLVVVATIMICLIAASMFCMLNGYYQVPMIVAPVGMILIVSTAIGLSAIRVKLNKQLVMKTRMLEEMKMQSMSSNSGGSQELAEPLSEIERLKNLLDSGAITQQEYDEAKARLLRKL